MAAPADGRCVNTPGLGLRATSSASLARSERQFAATDDLLSPPSKGAFRPLSLPLAANPDSTEPCGQSPAGKAGKRLQPSVRVVTCRCMWRMVPIAAATCLLVACGATHSSVSQLASPTLVVPGGCGATKLYRGRPPGWTAPAFSDSSPGSPPWPHAVSKRGDVAAIVFGNPLRAGHPKDHTNKILWIVRLPRLGLPLRIEATPLHATAQLIRYSWPADSSPGEIYPSYVNVPTAGCWQLTLRWAGHTDSIDLHYKA